MRRECSTMLRLLAYSAWGMPPKKRLKSGGVAFGLGFNSQQQQAQ
jgi:hypothetical protein